MSLQPTLLHVSVGRGAQQSVPLLVVWFEYKKVQGFWKGQGLMGDLDGRPVWFTLSAPTEPEMQSRSKLLRQGCAALFGNLRPIKSQWYSGFVVDLNQGRRVRVVSLDSTHQTYAKLRQAPLAADGEIRMLLSCKGKERVDIRGVVLEAPTVGMAKGSKAVVWLADTSGAAVIVELWGPSFLGLVRESVRCGVILEIRNASVKVSDKGLVSLSGEFFGDSEKGHAFARVLPSSPETAALEAVREETCERISEPWTPTYVSAARMSPDGQPFVSSLSTIRVCSDPWGAESIEDGSAVGGGSEVADGARRVVPLPIEILLQVHGAWLVDVPVNPVWRKCLMCNTKIDNVLGLCKKAKESSCNTTPSSSLVVYGRVRIADASGSTEDMMIDEDPLCAFAGVGTVQELADMIDTGGLQSITFRTRCDIRVGANRVQVPRTGDPATSVEGRCDWQLLLAKPVLLGPWNTEQRPAVSCILDAESDASVGAVVPVSSPRTELEVTPMGARLKGTGICPEYLYLLCKVGSEVQEEVGEGEASLTYTAVRPYRHGEESTEDSSEAFALRILCSASELAASRLSPDEPRLVVGRVCVTGAGVLVVAERVFELEMSSSDASVWFDAERRAVLALLAARKVGAKRSGKVLVEETPSKRRCLGIGAEFPGEGPQAGTASEGQAV